MVDQDRLRRYNYDSFIPKNFEPWMRFDKSPILGDPAPDFPLTTLDGQEKKLSDVWSAHALTVVEFGSFT